MIPSVIRFREQILSHLAGDDYQPAKLKDLARRLGVGSHEYRLFRGAMRDLEEGGEVRRVGRQRYVLSASAERSWGRLSIHARGFGLVSRNGQPDLFVPAEALSGAADGDWVEVEITEAGKRGRRPRGRISGTRAAAPRQRVGIYRRRGRHGAVATADSLVHLDEAMDHPPGEGDLVVVELETASLRPVRGRLARVIGSPEDPRHDLEAATAAHAIPTAADPRAEAEAGALLADAGEDRKRELERRLDLRNLTVLTVDPEEARDYDDAISLESLPDGCQRLGVHIADVAHYVPRRGAIDGQARERGTSAYLLDRVVHMLPSGVATGLCSLAPGEDRLAVSVFLDIDGAGRVIESQFHLSVVRSAARLTYVQVESALEDGAAAGRAAGHRDLLRELCDLGERLRARRLDRGAIDFDLPEAVVEVGGDGVPVRLGRGLRGRSHRLVEECMLAANEAVASKALEAGLPVLYRIHDPPDPEKLDRFRTLAGSLGRRLPPSGSVSGAQLQHTLEALQGRSDSALLGQLMLRSMMRARYAPSSSAHFGLACEPYLHFTSPIRRYPDLLVHRLLKDHLLGIEAPDAEDAEWLGEWTSHCERRAEAAERDYRRIKQLRFMARRLGEEVDGIVSGVVGAGIFVELDEWLVEGFCPQRLLPGDDFEFDELRHRMRGRRTGLVLAIGTAVRVRVERVEPSSRRMDLQVLEVREDGRSKRRRQERPGGRGDRRASARAARQGRRSARRDGRGRAGKRR